ncbi:hypothetical protein J5N97_001412 [Dioscorea zingiberensis]|uniref:Uncharacterized protein n=1 Tax=Dioscorea zingiberensis TaxID=325984 RepID=A0A9D5BU94_9LILI|nr:hypothetical protein J5N97_001412 [Dioscorea zingiberensis]
MDASSQAPKVEATRPLRRPPKRLVFDRRYGWVYDEWRDPLEVALSGGRGMFCIVPIVKSLLSVASQLMNAATDSVVRNLRNPNQFSLQSIHANLSFQFQKLMQFVQSPVSRCRLLKQVPNVAQSNKS